jgi:hypothetical protein
MHSFRHSGGACAGLDPVAGIQCSQEVTNPWTPFFNGVTTFYEIINVEQKKMKLTMEADRLKVEGEKFPREKPEGLIRFL